MGNLENVWFKNEQVGRQRSIKWWGRCDSAFLKLEACERARIGNRFVTAARFKTSAFKQLKALALRISSSAGKKKSSFTVQPVT